MVNIKKKSQKLIGSFPEGSNICKTTDHNYGQILHLHERFKTTCLVILKVQHAAIQQHQRLRFNSIFNYCDIFLEGQQMLKVVLILKEISLRLKESELYVIIRKKKQTFPLATKCKITKGLCLINSTTQFYLSPSDSSLNIEVIFLEGDARKLAGNTILNITQWEPNVLHQTVSALNNSPDKKARMSFNFYYFVDHSVNDSRPMFLSSDRYHDQTQTLYEKTHQLIRQTKELKKQLKNEEWRNRNLLNMRARRQLDISQAEKVLKDEVELFKKSIHNSNQNYSHLKDLRMKLSNLVKEKGLLGSENL